MADAEELALIEISKKLKEINLGYSTQLENQKQTFDAIRSDLNNHFTDLKNMIAELRPCDFIPHEQPTTQTPASSATFTAVHNSPITPMTPSQPSKPPDPPDISISGECGDDQVSVDKELAFVVLDQEEDRTKIIADEKLSPPLRQNIEHLEGKHSQQLEFKSHVNFSSQEEFQEDSATLTKSSNDDELSFSQKDDRVWEPGGLPAKLYLWDWPDKESKSHEKLHQNEMFLYPHMQVVKWGPEEFKNFDRERSNKALYLEGEHEQKQVMKLISSKNRVWEPGGVSNEHDKLKGLEKCCEGTFMRLTQQLFSIWWQGIKSKELDRLAACSYGLEALVLSGFKERCILSKKDTHIVLFWKQLESLLWFVYGKKMLDSDQKIQPRLICNEEKNGLRNIEAGITKMFRKLLVCLDTHSMNFEAELKICFLVHHIYINQELWIMYYFLEIEELSWSKKLHAMGLLMSLPKNPEIFIPLAKETRDWIMNAWLNIQVFSYFDLEAWIGLKIYGWDREYKKHIKHMWHRWRNKAENVHAVSAFRPRGIVYDAENKELRNVEVDAMKGKNNFCGDGKIIFALTMVEYYFAYFRAYAENSALFTMQSMPVQINFVPVQDGLVKKLAYVRMITQDLKGVQQLMCGDVEFHLKHKWRYRLLQTLSELGFCVGIVMLITSHIKVAYSLLRQQTDKFVDGTICWERFKRILGNGSVKVAEITKVKHNLGSYQGGFEITEHFVNLLASILVYEMFHSPRPPELCRSSLWRRLMGFNGITLRSGLLVLTFNDWIIGASTQLFILEDKDVLKEGVLLQDNR